MNQKCTNTPNKETGSCFPRLSGILSKIYTQLLCDSLPLSDLTKKDLNRFVWTESQQNAFDTLKNMLSSRPIIKLPDFQETLILRTDAADDGIGAVLLQMEGGVKLPVAYASRNFNREKNRCD